MDNKFSFIESTFVLLALVIAFYGLIAQWKKIPYMVNSMFKLALHGLSAVCLGIGTVIIFHISARRIAILETYIKWFDDTVNLGIPLYICVCTLIFLWLDHKKYYLFKADISFTIKWLKNKKRYLGHRSDDPDLKEEVEKTKAFLKSVMQTHFYMSPSSDWFFINHTAEQEYSLSVFCQMGNNERFNNELYSIALDFLENGAFVQYVSCDRHPIEFLNGLKDFFLSGHTKLTMKNNGPKIHCVWTDYNDIWTGKKSWRKENSKDGNIDIQVNYKDKLILIDGHTNHYGFKEDIYKQKTAEAKVYCHDVITSKTSYPGIHSALKKGFISVTKNNQSSPSRPGLIIYENVSSLIDIESPEQYRIFMRHVVASERLMGGIFTVFYENNISEENSNFAKTITDKSFTFKMGKDIAYSTEEIKANTARIVNDNVQPWIASAVGRQQEVVMLTVLNGGKIFANDLLAEIKDTYPQLLPHIKAAAVKVHSYDGSGQQQALSTLEFSGEDLAGKAILVVDDICHSGKTLDAIVKELKARNCADIKTVVAIQRSEGDSFAPDWYLFRYQDKYNDFPEAWMYGYGMDNDYDEGSRLLPHFVFSRRNSI